MTEVVQSSLDDKTIILKKRDSLKCMDRGPLYTTMDTTMVCVTDIIHFTNVY